MSINMTGKFGRISDIGNSAGTRNLQKKSTSVDGYLAGGFKNLLADKMDTSVKSTNKNQDTLTISGYGNVPQRLAELQKLHEETDYSGMTDIEIDKLIEERYEKAFPNRRAKMMLNTEKYQDIGIQQTANLREVIKNPNMIDLNGEADHERQKEYLGYQDLSNSEIIQKIKQDIPDDGSLENKVEITHRLWAMGVISNEAHVAFSSSIDRIQWQTFKETFGEEAAKDNKVLRNWIKSGGTENIKMSWGEMKEFMYSSINIAEVYGQKVKEELDNLFDNLMK